MRVVFAGTPPFAVAALEALLAAGHDVPLVLTQPDRPAGRGLRLTASAVSECAARHGLALYKPPSLKLPESQGPIREAMPDVMVVAAYGLILPAAVLAMPGKGCINIHASLLPRWRGAAPIQRAILAGDPETGVCIMQMETGLDTGPVLLERSIPIAPRDTAAGLTRSLAALGAEALVDALGRLESLAPKPQDATRATYAAKIDKSEARIDWTRSARDVDRQIRAFNPVPGAETTWKGQSLKIWEALPATGSGPPGTLLGSGPEGLVIACGEGALAALEIQRQGSKRLGAGDFLRGYPLEAGGLFGI
ncbi:Methionyl-tRNA formyltransferase [Usitatibacter rugosus]|uniref:Methionyl-tRNA formyltransferase n=1 Tax=Usitatibacter rugosus TaxID=2732067 RepID=A0A6M4GPH8_9PROT|nr:methionyl-tRNA formyltransferase [Usitatibacter rugosus]QJR08976.1 Methionyl-tRNA formyltransferase [Usitatibacter rugosus]